MKIISTKTIDELGRIIIPKEIREMLCIEAKEEIEIGVDDDNRIFLQKKKPHCIFCHSTYDLIKFSESYICPTCQKNIINMSKF